tara:strand:+ start:159 stop:419 length:261 start_codon:yes stop_codon:yes gene_type:complete
MNSKYLEIYNPPISSIAIDEIDLNTFTISAHYNKRPDLLAYDELGDSRLWWVFALFNRQKLRDPVNDFKSGVELKIPTKAQIERLI